MSIVSDLRRFAAWSENSWEAAIDGAEIDGDDARIESLNSLSESCASSYEAAIETVEVQGENWEAYARQHLADAKNLESEGGDASHAKWAIEALEDYLSEGDEASEALESDS